ncbi:MAG: hypothetical protein ACOVNL_00725 [Prochlorococcaceae cyanobacterium]|jgi:hypothetical protein
MSKKCTKVQALERQREAAQMLATGWTRREIVQHAAETWGVGSRQADDYIARARDDLRQDWDIERPQMLADLFCQLATLQQEARKTGQLHIALGCINTAAKLARLCS